MGEVPEKNSSPSLTVHFLRTVSLGWSLCDRLLQVWKIRVRIFLRGESWDGMQTYPHPEDVKQIVKIKIHEHNPWAKFALGSREHCFFFEKKRYYLLRFHFLLGNTASLCRTRKAVKVMECFRVILFDLRKE